MRSPTRKGPRSVLTMDQSPTSSTPSLTPSMVRVAALAHAVPDMAFTVAACPAMYLCAACAISPDPSAATPGQADRVQNSGVEAQRPHRRDQMRGIAHEEHAIASPLRRHPMMNAVDDGVEDFHLVDWTDGANDLRAEFGGGGLGDAGGKRIEETPAVRLAHQDHPFLGIGKIGEIGIVARIGDVEIDLDVDQQAADVGRLSFHRHA